jgi:hypothetical protein
MEVRNAGRSGQAPYPATAKPVPAVSNVPSWYRRVTFWRSIAGMAFALALACAAVTAEYSTALIERTRHYHFRLHQLSSNITAMRGEIAVDDRKIARMRNAAQVEDGLRRIITEPDSRLIKLEAPGRAKSPSGVIAFSPGLRRAAIEIGGLPLMPNGGAYTLWWLYGKHQALRATGFTLAGVDRAAFIIALPVNDKTIEGACVTTDQTASSQASNEQPTVEPVLKGTVVPSPAHTEVLKRKSG